MAPAAPARCPLLGLLDDRGTHFAFPQPEHRCFAKRSPGTIELDFQAEYCLTAAYPTCPRYQNANAATAVKPRVRRVRSIAVAALILVALVVAIAGITALR